MDREKFRQIVQRHLVPLFSGARLEAGFEQSTRRQPEMSWQDPCSFYVKPGMLEEYCVVLSRSQPFAKTRSPFVTEYRVVKAFVKVLQEIERGIGTLFEQDLLAHFTRRVVVRSICDDDAHQTVVLAVIDQLDTWSTRLYEGQPISAAIGFVPGEHPVTVTLDETWKDDYSAVLSNGFDTIVVSSHSGHVHSYKSLPVPKDLPMYAPYRLAPIAEWTHEEKGRIAIALNRTGEILVIRDGQLVFARRGGRWHFLTHEPVITQMKCPQDKVVRQAVYASCLDASFARTGACVGIMASGDIGKLDSVAPKRGDHIQTGESTKAQLIRQIINGKRFQELDRRMRQELLAIDGATILSHKGQILTVGAILHIEGGSSGGGRLAAAIALSKHGTGIKVSQDGGIRGYYRCEIQDTPDTAEPDFVVM
ncbi:MAG: hypothetical protein AB9873_19410 [Syntrophobacteraceae bacterium]